MATPMERAPAPDLEYIPIPKERYTSAEFARLEWEHMWTKTWLYAGRESDIPNPGDYFTFEIGTESILVASPGLSGCGERPGAGRRQFHRRGARAALPVQAAARLTTATSAARKRYHGGE